MKNLHKYINETEQQTKNTIIIGYVNHPKPISRIEIYKHFRESCCLKKTGGIKIIASFIWGRPAKKVIKAVQYNVKRNSNDVSDATINITLISVCKPFPPESFGVLPVW